VSYCELNFYLLDVLRLKYADRANVHFVTRDFEELDLQEFKTRFDRIIMNPPFERGRDIDHVLRAYNLLAHGGLLAAIVSEGGFCRQDKKAQAFREFLKSHNASTLELPRDSFKASGTRVSCRIVRVKKGR
jgi:predicted RNA methylase